MLRQASPSRWSIVADGPSSRLDQYLSKLHPDRSRSYIQKLITDGYVRVNDRLSRAGTKVKRGDRIEVAFPSDSVEGLTPASMPLTVVYEDEEVLVVDKAAGIPMHPGSGNPNRNPGQCAAGPLSGPEGRGGPATPRDSSPAGQRHVRVAGGGQVERSAGRPISSVQGSFRG